MGECRKNRLEPPLGPGKPHRDPLRIQTGGCVVLTTPGRGLDNPCKIMVTNAFRPVERSRPQYRRSLIFAGAIFTALLCGNLTIFGHLVFRDLGDRMRKEAVSGAKRRAVEIARKLAEQGQIKLYRRHIRETVFSSYIDQVLTEEHFVHTVSVYDTAGHHLRTFTRWGERFYPSAPGFHLPPPGSDVPESEAVDDSAVPSLKMATQERDQYIAVPIPSPDGSAAPGSVEVGIAEDQLNDEIDALRRSLMIKVVAGAAISITLLLVAFFYVVRLLRRTRRLEAEAQLADRLAYVGTLASGLAHEIRNPLNAMNMNLQMLEEEIVASAAAREDTASLLASTKGEVKRLEVLVNDFLAYARPADPRFEPGDVNRTVEEVVRFLRAELQQKGIAIETTLDGSLSAVEMDGGQIRQALLNILINAKEILGPGGRIDVTTAEGSKGDVEIRVRDNGPGIPADLRQRIFEVFYSTRGGGTGLGLPIAQRILESHGGRIELESEVGAGSTFILHLPVLRRAEGRSAQAPVEAG